MSFAQLGARTHTSAATAQRRLHQLRPTGGAEVATVFDRCQVGLDVQAAADGPFGPLGRDCRHHVHARRLRIDQRGHERQILQVRHLPCAADPGSLRQGGPSLRTGVENAHP
ncbi:hypothetical protein [Streptomyces sp. NPDC048641]|uniref:hypothetical protein n=1 Tax=Streptomyces sp. NPDC048641 TaxID=3154825 RepID=UPI003419EF43